jgi:hypothetical protein
MQLMAGQLDREHVVGLRVQHDLHDRAADVAHRGRTQPGREQDRLQHLGGRGLAVGASDSEPRDDLVGRLSRQASSTSLQIGSSRWAACRSSGARPASPW